MAQNHPAVRNLSHQKMIGYDDAELIIRAQAMKGDADAKAIIATIDEEVAQEKAAMAALNADMARRFGGSMDDVDKLVALLESDPELERWLLRRVNLTRANGKPLSQGEHHWNSDHIPYTAAAAAAHAGRHELAAPNAAKR